MKLISTKLTNLVSLEQSHHKPVGMYGGGLQVGNRSLISSFGATCLHSLKVQEVYCHCQVPSTCVNSGVGLCPRLNIGHDVNN